jgi:hypothetical protein
VLLPEELLHFWRGIEGWRNPNDPSDTSDYARACRVRTWLGVVSCHTGKALILSGAVGPVGWIADAGNGGGFLVQWIGVDDEASIGGVLRGAEVANVLKDTSAEEVEFPTGASGVLRLFDSAEFGNELRGDCETLRLVPGSYRVRAGYFESPSLMIVVRQITRT